jgi:predicted RND superfamily exporter protein
MIIDWRWLLFLVATVVTVPAYLGSQQLKLDRSLEKMFSESDPVLQDYRFLKKNFGGNEVVLVVYRDSQLWTPGGIERVDDLANALREIDGVDAAMDLAQMSNLVEALLRTNPTTFLSGAFSNEPAILNRKNPIVASMLEMFAGFTHGQANEGELSNYASIACLMNPSTESSRNRPFQIQAMRTLLDEMPSQIENPSLVGESVMVNDGFEMVQADGRRLGVTSSIILAVLLLIGFRSIRWTLIAVLIVQWSLLVTNGLLWMLDLQLTMVSSMLTSIVTVIGVATMIHWMLGYQKCMDVGDSPIEALRNSLSNLIRPIALACVTDAIGFGALVLSAVGPVQDYGLMMALASLVVLGAILMLVPFLALIGTWGQKLTHLPKELEVRAALAKWLGWVEKHRGMTIAMVIVLAIVSIIGAAQVRVETNFVKNFRSSSELVQSYHVVEEHLGGAGVWDCLLPVPNTLDMEFAESVLRFENRLRAIEVETDGEPLKLSKVLSLFDTLASVNNSPIAALLPMELRMAAMRSQMPEMMDSLLMSGPNADGDRYMRIMLRSREQDAADSKNALIEKVRTATNAFVQSQEWQSHFSEQPITSTAQPANAKVTGYYILLTRLVESLVSDQWLCFSAAAIAIFLMLWAAIGRWRLAAIALIPNLLPPVVVVGVLGFLGWRMNLGIAMIAAVSIGISIDSSLHYLSRYRREMHQHGKAKKALNRTHNDVGLAIGLATLALILGFGSLVTSDFLPTVAFGTTAALTMLGGLIGNLWLLPALLSVVDDSKGAK